MKRVELGVSMVIFILISLFSLALAEEFMQFGSIGCLFLLIPIQSFAALFFVLLIISCRKESGH